MEKLSRASKGKKMLSLPAHFLSTWYGGRFDTLVDLPMSVTNELIVFSIHKELVKRQQFKGLSEKSVNTLIEIVSSAVASLDIPTIKKQIHKSGIDLPDDVLEDTIKEIRKEVNKQVTGAGVASILVNDVLKSKVQKMSKPDTATFEMILDGVERVQSVYSAFAESVSTTDVVNLLNSLNDNQLIAHLISIRDVFYKHKSPTVKGRLSYALDTMYENVFGEHMVDLETFIPGMHYHVKSLKFIKNVKFKQIIVQYFLSLRGIMGMNSGGGSPIPSDMQEVLNNFIMNIPDQAPVLPHQLACSSDEIRAVNDLFTRLWLINCYDMIMRQDEGMLAHQIANVMNERKYSRNETWEATIQSGIAISSIVFTSYIRTSAMFRDWARNENIYFSADDSITWNVKKKLNDWVFNSISGYNTFLPLEHPRFLNSPGHIINYSDQAITEQNVDYFVPDDNVSFKKTKEWVIDINSLVRTLVYKTKKIQGTEIDLDITVPRQIAALARPISVIYGMTLARPALYGGDVSTAMLGIKSLQEVLEQSPIASEIMGKASVIRITSKYDFASTFDLPEELAEEIYKEPGYYLDLSSQGSFFLTWDPNLAPVVEFSGVDTGKNYVPFISQYPYLLVYSNTLPNLVHNKQEIGRAHV